jgi:hypothetical protein
MVYMDRNNVDKLKEQLRDLGVGPLADPELVRDINEDAGHFKIRCQMPDKNIRYLFEVNFYKLDGSDDYTIDHYKGTMKKIIQIPDVNFDNVNTAELESRMRTLPWDAMLRTPDGFQMFMPYSKKLSNTLDGIWADLDSLDSTKEGRYIRGLLEAKYTSEPVYIKNTSIQLSYDRMENKFNTTIIFPVRDRTIFPLQNAPFFLQGINEIPERLQLHEVYGVFTDGLSLQGKNDPELGQYFKENHYFSSIDKAGSYIQGIDDRYFLPPEAIKNNFTRIVKQAVITEEIKDVSIASKQGTWSPHKINGKSHDRINWLINTNLISINDFEKKAGIPLSKLGNPTGKKHIIQVYPPPQLNKREKQAPSKTQVKKNVPPDKKKRRGI